MRTEPATSLPSVSSLSDHLVLRRAGDRGHAEYGWLDSHHTFSFGGYHDPAHMGFRALRVINDDRVAPSAGFPPHPHRDMEIVSYVVDGALEHRDSMGNGSVIRPGEVQRMSAGTGVTHSEYNASPSEGVRFLQIWIVPEARGLEPGYEQRDFGEQRHGRLRLVASRDGREGSVTLHQDVSLYASVLDAEDSVTFEPTAGKHLWVQVVRGRLRMADAELSEGDGASLEAAKVPSFITFHATSDTELLVFELA